jgi:hypothetical protein
VSKTTIANPKNFIIEKSPAQFASTTLADISNRFNIFKKGYYSEASAHLRPNPDVYQVDKTQKQKQKQKQK